MPNFEFFGMGGMDTIALNSTAMLLTNRSNFLRAPADNMSWSVGRRKKCLARLTTDRLSYHVQLVKRPAWLVSCAGM
jgi:hypothetical protein